MSGFWNHFVTTLRLNWRNPQAMVFGYFVPLFFLIAFRAFYGGLTKELAQVLTISVMGGACFGMPVAMVTERDRGVWRRYRLVPMGTIWFVLSTMLARYVIVLTSALLQIAVAMAFYSMPLPARPVELFIGFAIVSFAFLGLGLVIAMVSNSTGAVQALGQICFLPMIMIGGVGVKLSQLPVWAKHVSAFLPGRYAVEAMRACVMREASGLAGGWFNIAALITTGIATCLASSKMFRWEPDQKLSGKTKLWIIFCLIMWAAVGIAAEYLNIATTAPKYGF